MYYCLSCNKLHPPALSKEEILFTSGFRYLNNTLYPAGICKPVPKPYEPLHPRLSMYACEAI
ncbi:DUF3973 domain-containing protein [Paenibacillus sp. UNC451MF]|uniref:DUF3973 domain-containing protein n=1 Tax=Paenibacillus sp. UNC451MF TaxID=1449063 RepID=UPI0018CC71FF